MHKRRTLKPTKKKFFHQQQARALRLKHLKQRKAKLFARHALQFVVQDIKKNGVVFQLPHFCLCLVK
jgi:hypothetical protein